MITVGSITSELYWILSSVPDILSIRVTMLLRTMATLRLLKSVTLALKALAVTTLGNKSKILSSQKYLYSEFYP